VKEDFEDLDVDGMIILKFISNKRDAKTGLYSSASG